MSDTTAPDARAICQFCDDVITWDAEYESWLGETARCPARTSPGGHRPRILTLLDRP
jgi:hypothetical protein